MDPRAAAIFRERGHNPTYRDMSNSAASYAHPSGWGNMVRPGGVLYGMWRDVLQPLSSPPELRPVMSLHSRITLLKRIRQGETLGYGCTFEARRETGNVGGRLPREQLGSKPHGHQCLPAGRDVHE